MESTIIAEPSAEEAAELKAAIREVFQQIEQADARIKSYQEDTDRLRAETRAILVQLRAEAKA